jgi:hypothetical protein
MRPRWKYCPVTKKLCPDALQAASILALVCRFTRTPVGDLRKCPKEKGKEVSIGRD